MYLHEQQQIHKAWIGIFFQISIVSTPSLSPAVQPQQDPPTLNLAVREKG